MTFYIICEKKVVFFISHKDILHSVVLVASHKNSSHSVVLVVSHKSSSHSVVLAVSHKSSLHSIVSIGISVFEECNNLESIFIYNDNIEIDNSFVNTLGNQNKTTIYAHKGSTIENYASINGYKFNPLF